MEEIKNNNFEFDNSEGVSLKCLSCGSSLIFDPETQLFSCDVCHSSFTKDDLKIEALSDNDQTYDETFTEYDCPSCGAEILTDETTSTEFCAYCGNPVVLKGRINGQLKPNLIIPFKIDKDKAKEILVNELRTYSYIPNSFFNEANLDKITGIYYPFWEADLDIDCKLYAECTKVDTWVNGDKRFTRTSYYNVRRDGDIHFDDITINALKSADKSLVEGILPYPIKDHIPFNIAYLSGFYAKKNDLTFNDVKGEINQKVGNYSYDLIKENIRKRGI